MIFDTMHWHSHSCGWSHQSKRTLLYPPKSGVVIFWHHFWHMGMDRNDCTHKKWMPKVLPNMESHGIPWCSGEDIRSLRYQSEPFFSHLSESAEFAQPIFTLMNLENVLSQGGSNALPATLSKDWEDHQGESSVGIERLHVFLSFLHMYLFVDSITYCICYCDVLYLLLSLFFQKYIYLYLIVTFS